MPSPSSFFCYTSLTKYLYMAFNGSLVCHTGCTRPPAEEGGVPPYWPPNMTTETTVICVVNSMLSAMDQGHVGALNRSLDLLAAFDTVDHGILIDIMQHRFTVCGRALEWLAEFLTDRTQIVRVGGSESAALTLKYGVPQGAVTVHWVHRGCHTHPDEEWPGPSSVRRRYSGNAALPTRWRSAADVESQWLLRWRQWLVRLKAPKVEWKRDWIASVWYR